MAIDPDQIRALVERPAEALQVEVKTWLDLRTDEGVAKIVKTLFAIRNRNGGFLIVGFDNATMTPDPYALDRPVEELFSIDIVQGIVSRYANPAFEIEVAFQARDAQIHPVIVVTDGVRVPAVVRRDLVGQGGKKFLREGDLFFRTFNANGTASSARIMPADYADLLEVCFENREADIGRFLRRHLAGSQGGALAAALEGGSPATKRRERAFSVIETGSAAAATAMASGATDAQRERIADALTMRVGLALDPPRLGELPTRAFLNKVSASNPNLTGWPVWLVSQDATRKEERPYVVNGLWQGLVVALDGSWSEHVEFLRYDPRGEFYLQRVMQDDLTEKIAPGTALDVTLMIYRVAEVIVVGTNVARSLGWSADKTAAFAFRWTGLDGRALRAWINPLRGLGLGGGTSRTATVESFVEVPIETPHAAVAPYVAAAVAPLLAAFDGYSAPADLVETSVRKLIERKMDS
jgi:hypothetical protein